MFRRGCGGSAARGRFWLALLIACATAAIPAAAQGANPAFPGTNPAESPRSNTPDDSDFDECESDDADELQECQTYFGEEQYELFGFSPDTAEVTPGVHPVYADCNPLTDAGDGQLDAQGEDANEAAEENPLERCSMISGIRADTAWKFFGQAGDEMPGDPKVEIAILDTGIRWDEGQLRDKVALNEDELPQPKIASGEFCGQDDCNGDGAFSVSDFANDPRVSISDGDEESDTTLDGSDLIKQFSDGSDQGGNGYIDDIAGWDFFDDDNDPFDASSCCSADGHGSDRASSAGQQTNDGNSDGDNDESATNAGGEAAVCPDCQIVPLRVWDTFVVPIDYFSMAVTYAATNQIEVVEGAVGGLGNTRFARKAVEFADQQGVALMLVSSDINSANHNYPTNYNEAMYVAGALPDTAPNDTCTGPGGLGPVDVPFDVPEDFSEGCDTLLGMLGDAPPPAGSGVGVTPTLQPTTTSFFRNANLTQYGGKADMVLMGETGSANTGQAAGAAGLVASFGRLTFGEGNPLTGNEIRQLLTMSAEDVRPGNPANTNLGAIGAPFVDKASDGWDPHFGYGRVNLAGAMQRIADNNVPPQAQIDSPDWFAPINVEDGAPGDLDVKGHIADSHGSAAGDWSLELQCGQDATDADFDADGSDEIGSGNVDGSFTGTLGTIPQATLEDLAANCEGEVVNDAGRPAGGSGDGWPADPYPNPDPERHAFQIRLTVEEDGNPSNFGRYRKTLFAYEDDGNLPGWPKAIGSTPAEQADFITRSGGEVSPRLYDIDGDNKLDVLLANTSGEVQAFHADGTPVASFNGGNPVTTARYALEEAHPVPGALPTPKESPRVPAIGDIDGDLEPEIVLNAGEHIFAWDLKGNPISGFKGEPADAALDRSLSQPCKTGFTEPCMTKAGRAIFTGDRGGDANGDTPEDASHIKRGFLGSVALADLDCNGKLDIVAGALDQHLYAWDGNGNELWDPRKLDSPDTVGAEIVTTPAIAELDGNGCGGGDGGSPEVVIGTNEVKEADPAFPDDPNSIFQLFNVLIENATGNTYVYAVHGDGSPVEGWPVSVGVAAGDLLPLVLPSHDAAVLDSDDTPGDDEVSVSAGTSVQPGGTRVVDGGGDTLTSLESGPANSPDEGPILNLADYMSVGDILGAGAESIFKGGLTVNGAANLLATNQNLPYSHVEQAFDPTTGASLPGYPLATDDFQLLSQASIARVGSLTGQERQVLVGTGLYNLHAYGPAGLEPTGWPKFTGGWQQATPAVGDADGDGDLDVTTVTREGWSFLWDSDTDADSDGPDDGDDTTDDGIDPCDTSNDEWWTFHHDERSTNNYRGDGRPPGTPSSAVEPTPVTGEVTTSRDVNDDLALGFIAPGDDWLCGTAEELRVIVSPDPINEPTDGTIIDDFGAAPSGQTQSLLIPQAQVAGQNFVAVFYRDEAGNWGQLADASIPPVGGGGPDSDGDGDLDDADNCPSVPNGDQANADGDGFGDACEPDTDGDGIDDDNGAEKDNCDTVDNPGQEDLDSDDIGDACEPDTDGDGVLDDNGPENDNCDNTPNAAQTNTDGDAEGDACDADDDNDTVLDGPDNCDLQPNTDQADNDADGLGNVCDPTPNGNAAPGGGATVTCAPTAPGTRSNDTLTGTEGSDRIRGLRGRDRITGLGGDDCLFGNKGGDRIDGGAGNDQISAGNSRDRVIGGPGVDTIRTGTAPDRVNSRDGEADTINCGSARDRVRADASDKTTGCEVVKT